MIADFVGVRGGGLLVLGGAQSFGEGGWSGTPLAHVAPVIRRNDGDRSIRSGCATARPADSRGLESRGDADCRQRE